MIVKVNGGSKGGSYTLPWYTCHIPSFEVIPVRTQTLPSTDLTVSEICLGTGEMGGSLDRDTSFALLDRYVELGGNFIDTAHVYNDWIPGERSRSEKMIGAWMKTRGSREKIVLATKGGHYPVDGSPYVNRVTPPEILLDLEESLANLGVDQVDLYWLHRDNPALPVGEILLTLEKARAQGKIRYYAASNWRVERLEQAAAFARRNGLPGFVADQMLWSVAVTDAVAIPDQTIVVMDDTLFKYHHRTGLAALAYTSQANGLFSKMAAATLETTSPELLEQFPLEPNRERYARMQRVMRETGLTLTSVILGWLLSQPFVTLPIIGPKRLDHLEDSLSAAGVRLTAEQVNFIAA